MTRTLAFVPAWWFFQIPSTSPSNPWPEYGIGGAMVGLIVYLWSQDRKSRMDYQTEADKRYALLVAQLQNIINGNTTAMTTLADRLSGKISNCPLASDPVMGAWMRTWMEHSSEELQKRHVGGE